MAQKSLGELMRCVRRVLEPHAEGVLTDGELVERFATCRDEAAFEVLVHRHGPMVLSLCRSMLRDSHNAEDAFQATFLVLARKAGAVRNRGAIGSWLYGVAYRIAARARGRAERQRLRERPVLDVAQIDSPPDVDLQELRTLLCEELQRLPPKYRAPLVLCFLEGRTVEMAARELGWPRGSMSKRLQKGRDLLRGRLAQRGLALTSAALAAALAESTAAAALPAPLVPLTLQAAALFAAGKDAAAEAVAPRAVALANEGLAALFMTKLKVAACLATLGIALVLTGLAAWGRAEPAQVSLLPQEGPVVTQANDSPLTAERFLHVRGQIRPQPGEALWMEVPWLLDLHEARRQAAAEGKPIFLVSGSGATAVGPCCAAARSVGREPAFWTKHYDLITQNFVCVSVSNYEPGRQDAVGRFLRDAGVTLPGAVGAQRFLTAGGKVLGQHPRAALEQWKALPEFERAPGAVQVGDRGAIDRQRAGATPPAGGLILKIYYRAFLRDSDGTLRRLTAADLCRLDSDGGGSLRDDKITIPQAQPDHMWLSESEWRALLPANPRPGDPVPIPPLVAERLIRWHLNPLSVDGETEPLPPSAVRASELSLTVAEVSPEVVRMRLEGFAHLGEPTPAGLTPETPWFEGWGYEPHLLGHLEFDPRCREFTRIDIVALGDHFGRLGICNSPARPGLQPLGICFELVKGDRPMDRAPPGRIRNSLTYFEFGK